MNLEFQEFALKYDKILRHFTAHKDLKNYLIVPVTF